MSIGRVMPRDAINKISVFVETDKITVYNESQDRNDKADVSDLKTYFQGNLPSDISQNASDISQNASDISQNASYISQNASYISQNASDISSIEDIVDPTQRSISLVSGQISMRQKEYPPVSASGWYQIAKTGINNYSQNLCDLHISCSGSSRTGTASAHAEFTDSPNSKTFKNCFLSYRKGSTSQASGLNDPITSIRFAKNDSVTNAGAFLEIYIDVSVSVTVRAQLLGNIGQYSGFSLMDTLTLSTGLCPDGSAATYLLGKNEEVVETTVSTTGTITVGVDDRIINIDTSGGNRTITLTDGTRSGQKIKLVCSGSNLAYVRGSGALSGGRKSGIWDGGSSTGIPISNTKILDMEWSSDKNIWLVSDAISADYQDAEQRIIQSSNGDMEIICELTGVASTSIANIFGSSAGNVYYTTVTNSFSVPFTSAPDYLIGVLVSAISARLGVSAAAGYNVIVYTSLTGQTANATVYFVGKW